MSVVLPYLGRVALGQQGSEEGIGVAALSSSDQLLVSYKALATIRSVDGLICSLDHEQCAGVDWIYGIHGCQVQITCKFDLIRLDHGLRIQVCLTYKCVTCKLSWSTCSSDTSCK